jgi:hypothetical protein
MEFFDEEKRKNDERSKESREGEMDVKLFLLPLIFVYSLLHVLDEKGENFLLES